MKHANGREKLKRYRNYVSGTWSSRPVCRQSQRWGEILKMNLWEMGSEGISLIQLFHLMFQLMNFVLVVIKYYAS